MLERLFASLPRPALALRLAGAIVSACVCGSVAAAVLRVGPERELKTVGEAARLARDGDTVEVDAGDYAGDVAVWTQKSLGVRAVGGRVRLLAQGAHAEGKAIWVVRAENFSVEGFDFVGAAVPSGNGAGIRFEKGRLSVRDCSFMDNENGILAGNDRQAELDIADSEFGRNGRGDGLTHNLYAGTIARLSVRGSYFHHARVGHLLKSRAAVNHVLYNRLTDEAGGHASYELEFPNGGVAVVVGNLIEQAAQTENPVMVSYGIEGYPHAVNEFVLANNTLIDHRAQGGIFVRTRPGAGAVRLLNNLFVNAAGASDLTPAAATEQRGNVSVGLAAFDRSVDADYRWTRRPTWLAPALEAGSADGIRLRPDAQYRHPRRTVGLGPGTLRVGAVQALAQAGLR